MKTVMRRYQKLCFKYCISIALLDSLEKSLDCCICETSPSNPCIIVRKECKTLVGCNDGTKELLKIFSEVIAASKCGPLAMSLKLDHSYKQSTIKDQKSNFEIPLHLRKTYWKFCGWSIIKYNILYYGVTMDLWKKSFIELAESYPLQWWLLSSAATGGMTDG